MKRRAALGVALAAIAVVIARQANANGRYPQASQIVIDPSDATHWVARATFGILETHDSGGSWSWMCEDAVGYTSSEDPPIAVTADGSTIVAFSGGLRATHDGGCTWSSAGDVGFGIDVTLDPSNPHRALALARATTADAGAHVSLLQTSDDGTTWSAGGEPIAGDFVGETVEVGPTASGRVYASGNVQARSGGDSGAFIVKPALERSDDGGETWTRFTPDLPGSYSLFIGGVDRTDPDVLYARAVGTVNGQLLMSRDGGTTFTAIFTAPGDLLGLALSPDGATLVAGGPDAGIYLASTSDLAFAKVSDIASYCLTWVGTRLLTCAKEGLADFSVGASDDRGAHFNSVMKLASISPRACPSATAGAACSQVWPSIAATIQREGGGPPIGPPSEGNAVDDSAGASSNCKCSFRARRATPFGAWVTVAVLVACARRRTKSMRREARGDHSTAACSHPSLRNDQGRIEPPDAL
jgi:photosystem II stability/assembly factor-like uncharacterized protein